MRRGNELLFAWTDTDKGSQLRTARVKLAPPYAGAAR